MSPTTRILLDWKDEQIVCEANLHFSDIPWHVKIFDKSACSNL